MKHWLLKLNHWLFAWYYKRAGEHFKQWTLIKSVKLMIEHWQFEKEMHEGTKQLYKNCYKRNEELEKEVRNLKMQRIANDDQIKWANDFLGTEFTESNNQ